MIIVILEGGLGNQLFQYFAGLAEAKKNGASVLFNPYRLTRRQSKRKFELLKVFPDVPILPIPFQRILQHKGLLSFLNNYFPSFIQTDKSSFSIRKNWALRTGYFAGFNWVKNIKDLLPKPVQLGQPSASFNHWYKKIHSEVSVSIHIRRGDYLTMPEFGILNQTYYRDAIELINSRIENAVYFIFSDDPEWVRSQDLFSDHRFQIIQDPDLDDLESFLIMANCKHHIIANSTFSWCAAYLQDDITKLVIHPLRISREQFYPTDYFPPHWLPLENDFS